MEDIKTLANGIGTAFQSMARRGLAIYTPIVNDILNEKISAPAEIERYLESMLDFCYDDEVLLLYKKVCRFLYPKYPQLVNSAVMNYKEMWDSDESEVDE